MTTDSQGFTMVEVLIAMVLLGFAVLGVQAMLTDRLIGDVGVQDERALASQLAADRLQWIRTDPAYTELEDEYEATEASLPGFTGFKRITEITPADGYTTLTVRVVTPRDEIVARTTVIAAP
ncbi:MAG TPA: prepilin-type N-terminal cleavage/methylation domain-containing protein [Longimicrobiaceae bacterium]|nr:prepilin-type N-terminal cleavage/methylation domain-containing protein [Longimicrobiaceae bacterium]